jgi:hypothetical protein
LSSQRSDCLPAETYPLRIFRFISDGLSKLAVL